jgi:hypothetical protein
MAPSGDWVRSVAPHSGHMILNLVTGSTFVFMPAVNIFDEIVCNTCTSRILLYFNWLIVRFAEKGRELFLGM